MAERRAAEAGVMAELGMHEADNILRASSGSRYRTSLVAAGRQVLALGGADNGRASAPARRGALEGTRGASSPDPRVGRPPGEFDERDRASTPTPAGHLDQHGERRTVGELRAAYEEPSPLTNEFERIAPLAPRALQRVRTPEPQIAQLGSSRTNSPYDSARSAARTPELGEYWDELPASPGPYARQSLADESLPALPTKAELHQYIAELVDAKRELRGHFQAGVLAGVKAHYKSR